MNSRYWPNTLRLIAYVLLVGFGMVSASGTLRWLYLLGGLFAIGVELQLIAIKKKLLRTLY